MRVRIVLGPAGSGKTFRCLTEIRAALAASPEGPPLVLLAPKQATFQLERQLLADPSLPGYTRLQILSFERLAEFVLAALHQPPPQLLSEEGRVMVLRALLARHQDRLQVFHASARLPGFARQLSDLLREFQRYHLAATRLETVAAGLSHASPLAGKLRDLACLLRAYRDWLRAEGLQDADTLLDVAAEALKTVRPEARAGLRLAGLWLDGFAEMTLQELDLLATLIPACDTATLAFCLERTVESDEPPLSTWSLVGQTFRRCLQRLETTPGCDLTVENPGRQAGSGRFAGNPVLQHLEAHWVDPQPFSGAHLGAALRVVACANPDAEAVFAAREIARFVRDRGGRYRDIAVLLRSMDGYHDVLRRVFTRYTIPFFLDRREPVAHHPLAELTRSAVRLAAFGWRHDDWFGALKTGLVHDDESEIDWLENEALARGWGGESWRQPWQANHEEPVARRLEKLRQTIALPFQQFTAGLAVHRGGVTGPQLTAALSGLWDALGVARKLEAWSAQPVSEPRFQMSDSLHASVWQQMQDWLDNLALAFAREALPLEAWLPILEAGLAGLTVGAIPPVLDQVLIGTIDRSRNPDLQLALVLGVNESVFPAPPAPGHLLTETERVELSGRNVWLGPTSRFLLGHEQYYGYIAFTRSRRELLATFSARDADENPLNPSPFVARLRRLFPSLTVESAPVHPPWSESQHPSELIAPWLAGAVAEVDSVFATPEARSDLAELRQRLAPLATGSESLDAGLAEQLYGRTLTTSVSRLEQFAACPFRFFVHSGLRAEERQRFELDAREEGSFQHEVLAEFHRQLRAERKEWRDLTPSQARERIGQIAAALTPTFRSGLLATRPASRFAARGLTLALQDFVATLVGWMGQYRFDPRAVELGFGGPDDPLPAWELDLGDGHRLALRGKIDRVDLAAAPDPAEARCVVLDYKSSGRQLDPALLAGGVQLQLPAYLGVLRRARDPQPVFGVRRLVPAGVFYVNWRGQYPAGATRGEVLDGHEAARRKAYQHSGRFDVTALRQLDQRPGATAGDQFRYRLNRDGTPHGGNRDLMPPEEFERLLDTVEAQLIRLGREIFAGVIRVDPYAKRRQKACDHCDYAAVCRIDPWAHAYRALASAPVPTNSEGD